ncbi:MAG: Ig-like domain-containing protein [Bacilli bacterium]
MRKTMPYIILILFLISIIASYYGYKYRNHYTPAMPSIKAVKLSDNVVEVKYEIEEFKKDKDMYCLKKLATEQIEEDDVWTKAQNNKCNFIIDDNIYNFYLKNNYNTIIKINEASDLGNITNLSVDKEKVYLAINGTHTPTLTISSVGYADKTVKWISNNDSIASVDSNGKIKGLKNGNTKVIAKVMDKEISIDVVVTNLITLRPKEFNNKKKYLSCNIYSKEDNDLLDEILKDRINTVGYKTRAGVVEAARFLALEFPYKIRYFSENGRMGERKYKVDGEGRYYHEGLYLHSSRYKNIKYVSQGPKTWGCTMYNRVAHNRSANGLDCSGFITWVLVNGGFDPGDIGAGVSPGIKDLTDYGEKTIFNAKVVSSGKVKVGDLLSSTGPGGGHIAIIVGEDDDYYYVAESLWTSPNVGVVILPYSKKNLFKRYYYVMLMDSYYKEDGKLTKLWY